MRGSNFFFDVGFFGCGPKLSSKKELICLRECEGKQTTNQNFVEAAIYFNESSPRESGLGGWFLNDHQENGQLVVQVLPPYQAEKDSVLHKSSHNIWYDHHGPWHQYQHLHDHVSRLPCCVFFSNPNGARTPHTPLFSMAMSVGPEL